MIDLFELLVLLALGAIFVMVAACCYVIASGLDEVIALVKGSKE